METGLNYRYRPGRPRRTVNESPLPLEIKLSDLDKEDQLTYIQNTPMMTTINCTATMSACCFLLGSKIRHHPSDNIYRSSQLRVFVKLEYYLHQLVL